MLRYTEASPPLVGGDPSVYLRVTVITPDDIADHERQSAKRLCAPSSQRASLAAERQGLGPRLRCQTMAFTADESAFDIPDYAPRASFRRRNASTLAFGSALQRRVREGWPMPSGKRSRAKPIRVGVIGVGRGQSFATGQRHRCRHEAGGALRHLGGEAPRGGQALRRGHLHRLRHVPRARHGRRGAGQLLPRARAVRHQGAGGRQARDERDRVQRHAGRGRGPLPRGREERQDLHAGRELPLHALQPGDARGCYPKKSINDGDGF